MYNRMVMEEHFGFQDTCAYNHKRRSDSQNIEINSLHEEVQTLKKEVDTPKTNFKSVLLVRADVDVLKNP